MLTALDCQTSDYSPCSFIIFGALYQRASAYLAFVEQQVAKGLDACVMLPPRPTLAVDIPIAVLRVLGFITIVLSFFLLRSS